MKRLVFFTMLAAPLLGGCAVALAMSAAELAAKAAQPRTVSNAGVQPTAVNACTAQAARSGTPHIIDVEQRRPDLLIVWGTVTDATQHRRSFECRFTTTIASFKLREIGTSH